VVLTCVVRLTIAQMIAVLSLKYMNYRVINLFASYDLPPPTAIPPRV
jgi:hypothetical protein